MTRALKTTLDTRGRLIGLWLVVFFGVFFAYAHTDPLDIFYHLVVDGCLLGVWIVSAWGWGVPVVAVLFKRCSAVGAAVGLLSHLTRIALGLGIMSVVILLLGLGGYFGEISALVLLGGGFSLALIALAGHRHGERDFSNSLRQWLASPGGAHWLLILLAPFAAMMAAGGLIMPGILWGADDPSGYDVVEYHLQVPREWFEAGRITALHHNVFSFFPFNVEMHYLLAMNLHAGPWAGMFLAQWMHGMFIFLGVAAIYAAVRTFASPLGACLGALAGGCCPWLTMLGSVAYDEGGMLLFSALGFAWLLIPLADQTSADENLSYAPFIAAGLCAGFACGCKLTAVPMMLLAAPMIYLAIRPAGGTVSKLIAYLLTALLIFSPWLIRNQMWAHNPFFPEATSFFGHGDFSAIQVARWHQAHSPRPDQQSVAAHFLALWEQVMVDWRFGYVALPLAFVAAVSSIRGRQTRFLLLVFCAFTVFWLVFTHLQSRFFVPAIPIMAMLIGSSRFRLCKWIVIPVVAGWLPALMALNGELLPFSKIIGLESPALLRSQIYPAEVNAAVAQDKPLILVGDAKAFWFDMPMSRLHYRTVFDVDTSRGTSTIAAWMGAASRLPDGNVVIDPAELVRFSRTYLGVPIRPAVSDLRQVTVFDLHDPWLIHILH